MKSLKMFTICEICPADHLKQRQFPRHLQFCVLFLYLKFGLMNFLSTGTKKGTKFNGPAIFLGNSTEWNAINLARKKPIFFVANIT